VLGVDRDDLALLGAAAHERAPGDQRFLVGQGEDAALFERGQRGCEPQAADHAVEHDITGLPGQLGHRVGAGHDPGQLEIAGRPAAALRLGVEGELQILDDGRAGHADHVDRQLERLGSEQFDVAPARPQRDNPELIGVAAHDVDGLGADGPGRAEQYEVAHAAHLPGSSPSARVGLWTTG